MVRNVTSNNVEVQWLQQLEEVLAHMARVGIASSEEMTNVSGLQFLRGVMDGVFPYPNFMNCMDMWLVGADKGMATFLGRPSVNYYNSIATVHGGWLAALLDSAVACSVHSILEPKKSFATIELAVNFVKSLTFDVPIVRCIGQVVHAGSRIATAEARVYGARGELYAHCKTTCMIFDRK